MEVVKINIDNIQDNCFREFLILSGSMGNTFDLKW